jgi:hypothetical protein
MFLRSSSVARGFGWGEVKDVTKLMNSEPCGAVMVHRSPHKPNSFITEPRQLGRYDWAVNMVGLGLPVGTGLGSYLLLHFVQTGSGAYPASYTMSTEDTVPGLRRPGREVAQLSPFRAEMWSYTSTYVIMVGV